MRFRVFIIATVMLVTSQAFAAGLPFKNRLLPVLVKQVPDLLESYDAETGQFGKGIWISTDQNRMYPLAAAYAWPSDDNPYYKDPKLLDVIMKAGDALIADADEQGKWVFRKKDGSEWGDIWMPWTYSRWVRAYLLIQPDMPRHRREKWAAALIKGYSGISRNRLGHVHNIPAHHAMGLYIAGIAFDRYDWCIQARDFLRKVADTQAEGGYWSENVGPVVNYNFVYMDALGTYFDVSSDPYVLRALERGARFHYHFRYPDGSAIETIDERNPYHAGVNVGNVGFTFTPLGRRYLKEQWDRKGWDRLPADLIASLLVYGQEGHMAPAPAAKADETFVLTEGGVDKAATFRRGPWFWCLSAYTAPVPTSRWIQDRQNFVSVFHDWPGVIVGGGNTKLQPGWSNFTVGDMTLLEHRVGDTNPDFTPKGELYHVPSEARLIRGSEPGLDLTYGPETCRIRIRHVDENKLQYVLSSTVQSRLPVAAHLTLLPKLGEPLDTATGESTDLGETPIAWSADQVGGRIRHDGYAVHLPATASLHWPARRHNPYRKDGRSTPAEDLIEIRIPLDKDHPRHVVTIEILK